MWSFLSPAPSPRGFLLGLGGPIMNRRSFILACVGKAALATGLMACANPKPLPETPRRQSGRKRLVSNRLRDDGRYQLEYLWGNTTGGEAFSALAVLGMNGSYQPFAVGGKQFIVYVRRGGELYYLTKPIDQTEVLEDDGVEVWEVDYDLHEVG